MIKIKKKWLIYFQIYFILFSNFFITVLHIPSIIKYLSDVVTACLFIMMLPDKNGKIYVTKNYYQKYINGSIILFLLYCVLSSLMHFVSPIYFLWALRVTFRFYVFYIACIKYLKLSDVKKILSSFEKVYMVNLIIVLFQFVVLGLRMDFLGGIFGIEQGCNGYMNIFFIVVLTYEMNKYYLKKIKLPQLTFYTLTMFAVAGMAELKFFYVEAAIIIFLVLLVNKPSRKTVMFIIISTIALFVGLRVLETVFPEAYMILMDKDSINDYLAAGWTHGTEIARTTAIPMINEKFFDGKISNMLFGLGFGNCELSSFFQTPFAMMYSKTNYRNFTYAMQYLETGYIGLCLYVTFFVTNFICVLKNRLNRDMNLYGSFLKVLIVMIGINIWYGGTNKEDIAYIIYFCIAIFGVIAKEEQLKRKNGNIQ